MLEKNSMSETELINAGFERYKMQRAARSFQARREYKGIISPGKNREIAQDKKAVKMKPKNQIEIIGEALEQARLKAEKIPNPDAEYLEKLQKEYAQKQKNKNNRGV